MACLSLPLLRGQSVSSTRLSLASVAALLDMVTAHALAEVTRFDNFTQENDPHGEHDFGNFELCQRTFYWKIDLYNSTMDGGSEDPTNPEKTTRVLTLMLAEDY